MKLKRRVQSVSLEEPSSQSFFHLFGLSYKQGLLSVMRRLGTASVADLRTAAA